MCTSPESLQATSVRGLMAVWDTGLTGQFAGHCGSDGGQRLDLPTSPRREAVLGSAWLPGGGQALVSIPRPTPQSSMALHEGPAHARQRHGQ